MKLKNLLDTIEFKEGMNSVLDHAFLGSIKEELLQCDEFKEADEIRFIQRPMVQDSHKKTYQAVSYRLGSEGPYPSDEFSINGEERSGDIKFKKICYLYSIIRSPKMYNMPSLNVSYPHGALITPEMFSPLDIVSHRKIILDFPTENMQEMNGLHNEDPRVRLHNLLDDVIDNPDKYLPEGTYGYIIRGLFEEVEVNGITTEMEIGNLNLNYDDQSFRMVTYFDTFVDGGGEVELHLKLAAIPKELETDFMEFLDSLAPGINESTANAPHKKDMIEFFKKHGLELNDR